MYKVEVSYKFIIFANIKQNPESNLILSGFFSNYFVLSNNFDDFSVGDETFMLTLPLVRVERRMHCI